ncbi:hypothetical protein [Sphingobium sp. CAP-1]|uniref:hypothetical protein n=1 Tax=Sphingobium sp. CAP-1 TaxID=2676077 RepID=UPI0012BB3F84|nr:hypothetical protein [Sphingobium sp. CAP-1]QGP78651.1 hypothetical protein GL174_06365 [Sphingobium sp. CAP-1]
MLFCLVVTALTTSGTVHAREISGPPTIECSGYVHSDGDRDETQGDSDEAVPHHHGTCHGAVSLLPGKIAAPRLFDLSSEPKWVAVTSALGPWSPGPDLRPPIA